MAINVTHLRSFFHVADALSFTQAAKNARVSQPTLTRQIKALEMDYGVLLFERTTSHVRLTEEGAQLFQMAQPIFKGLEDAEAFLKNDHAHHVRLEAVACEEVTELLVSTQSAFPYINVDVKMRSSTLVRQSLLERTADFGILTLADPPDELDYFPIRKGEIVAIVPEGHPWHSYPSLSFKELEGQNLLVGKPDGAARRHVDKNLDQFGIKPASIREVESIVLLIDLAMRGLGVGVVGGTGLLEKQLGVSVPFKEESTQLDVHFACRKERLRTRFFRSFFEFAKAHLAL